MPATRRRRWPGRLLIFALLSVLCCCGCPAYYGKPMWDQYPATAVMPERVRDLDRQDDPTSVRTVDQLKIEMRTEHLVAEDVFAGVYAHRGGPTVVLFGAIGFRWSPDKDLAAEVNRLNQPYQLRSVESIDTNVRGFYQQCGIGRADGDPVVVCVWADHGSLGSGVFSGLSVSDSADLLDEFRDRAVLRN